MRAARGASKVVTQQILGKELVDVLLLCSLAERTQRERSKDQNTRNKVSCVLVLCVLKKRSAEKEFCLQYAEFVTRKDFQYG